MFGKHHSFSTLEVNQFKNGYLTYWNKKGENLLTSNVHLLLTLFALAWSVEIKHNIESLSQLPRFTCALFILKEKIWRVIRKQGIFQTMYNLSQNIISEFKIYFLLKKGLKRSLPDRQFWCEQPGNGNCCETASLTSGELPDLPGEKKKQMHECMASLELPVIKITSNDLNLRTTREKLLPGREILSADDFTW